VRRRPAAFDRTEAMIAADRARARGRRRKAVALYRQVLAAHPEDLAAQGKLAPLLAAAGDREAALASFRDAAAGHERAGFADRALSLLLQATDRFPSEEPLWAEMARLHLSRGRRADAVAALTRGAAGFLSRRELAPAERMLGRATQLQPWHPEASLLLARVWGRAGRAGDALQLLDALAARTDGRPRARARRLAFRLSPTPLRLWRWIRA
jgi:tetratricopeptide (TPR) repeat protein